MIETVMVGAVAYEPKVVTIWEIMRETFQKENYALDYVLFSNYEALVEALMNGSIDIAWNTNVAYVKVQEKAKGKARNLGMRDTDLDFTSKLVVREDSTIQSIRNLKGKRVALGSRDSAQAAILPSYYLAKEGYNLKLDLSLIRFDTEIGKHGDTGTSEMAVLEAIEKGEADAGAIGCSTWIRLLETGLIRKKNLKSIWTSPGYSNCNFTCLPNFNSQLAEQFTQILLNMDPQQPDIKQMMDLEGLNEWVLSGNEGYHDLAKAMRILKMIERDPQLV
ncbi:phosphate/phosphite/phosphonate ABC transporter substrate-binding protein [Bacillus benzoevorans]|uniref:Phosphate/phosphite/phosphonate ABC transporter binding protein n=1 Tax=Bacillus benzoevorans TaxID=1456 RepID=A0A7X0HTP2_9BACI|nr:PhnD/SsuA/transferrin family substrate-binding protein [Bacillus benzoevorans]MBB6446674.1 phosphate/phosphite/phosphonate ABC transporter binding protein [Bacillus benzoevorans]